MPNYETTIDREKSVNTFNYEKAAALPVTLRTTTLPVEVLQTIRTAEKLKKAVVLMLGESDDGSEEVLYFYAIDVA